MASRAMLTLGLVFGINSVVNFANPMVVLAVRIAYGLVVALQYFAWKRVVDTVEAAQDRRPIWVKAKPAAGLGSMLSSMMGGGDAAGAGGAALAYNATTYYDLESDKAKAQMQQAMSGPIMMFVMSMFMGMHLPLAMQIVLTPLGLYDDVTVKRHLLAGTPLGGLPSATPYDELLSDPAGPTPAPTTAVGAVTDAATTTTTTDGAAPAAGASSAQVECEEVVFRTWESTEPADVGVFEALITSHPTAGTFQTAADGWSAVMVVAGGEHNTAAEVTRLLELGYSPALVDKQGWTALHWAAYHNRPAAMVPLLATPGGARTVEAARRLLRRRNAGGHTALQLAHLESSAACVATLEGAYTTLGLSAADVEEDGIAAPAAAAGAVEAVDAVEPATAEEPAATTAEEPAAAVAEEVAPAAEEAAPVAEEAAPAPAAEEAAPSPAVTGSGGGMRRRRQA